MDVFKKKNWNYRKKYPAQKSTSIVDRKSSSYRRQVNLRSLIYSHQDYFWSKGYIFKRFLDERKLVFPQQVRVFHD